MDGGGRLFVGHPGQDSMEDGSDAHLGISGHLI